VPVPSVTALGGSRIAHLGRLVFANFADGYALEGADGATILFAMVAVKGALNHGHIDDVRLAGSSGQGTDRPGHRRW